MAGYKNGFVDIKKLGTDLADLKKSIDANSGFADKLKTGLETWDESFPKDTLPDTSTVIGATSESA